MNHQMTDAQLHSAAINYQAGQPVNYMEALQAVLNITAASNFGEMDLGADMQDDVKMHKDAVHYAATHNVSYERGLLIVSALRKAKENNYGEAASLQDGTASDAQIDAAATLYALQKDVSYMEALDAVWTPQAAPVTAYSEANAPNYSTMSDARMDAAAKRFVQQHGGSYMEALTSIASNGISSYGEAGSAAALLEKQPIEIFKAGTLTDNSGGTHSFSVADIAGMAAAYNRSKHEAPLTLGHPADNLPAYGWVESLQAAKDGILLAKVTQVDAQFAEDIRAGRFKKRSASFYAPYASNNPVPGSWYLRHVAWLGALPPAVRGMADANFEEKASEGVIHVDF